MLKKMKQFKKLVLVIPAFLLIVSCGDDFTILAPQSERNVENFYQTDTDFRTAINGAYAGLASNSLYGRNFMLLHEMRSDNTSNAGGQPDWLSPWSVSHGSMNCRGLQSLKTPGPVATALLRVPIPF